MDEGDGGGGSGGQGGRTTPGVIVTAQNPGTSSRDSQIRISLTAHSARSGLDDPSCRPQDAGDPDSIDCWASLVLRIPDSFADIGGLVVTDFEVHRIAVGDTSCGGCSEDEAGTLSASVAGEHESAQVNGRAVVVDPGNSNLGVGDQVQLKMALTDAGPAQYHDTVAIQVNEFAGGPAKEPIGETGPQIIQQVQIHYRGGN